MSRAFVKEPDGDEAFEDLPDRPISPHANFVTAEGLAKIESEVARLHDELADAQAAHDKAAIARLSRDHRYWTARRSSAQLVEPLHDAAHVRFGSTVTIARDDGRRQTWRIVGEDEADPAHGTLSHVSPMAQALMGKEAGDVATVGESEVEIISIG
jgi:transcription elongation GreA/GreB family factor